MTLTTFLMISGCINTTPDIKEVQKIVYVSVPINKPQKPEIPKISSKDISCLTKEQKNKLIDRDNIIKSYISDLESTIESTH